MVNHSRTRFALISFALLLLGWMPSGCSRDDYDITPDPRPAFVLDSTKPFVIEIGQGSGLDGLDIIRVEDSGMVLLTRFVSQLKPESASLQLSKPELVSLVSLVNKLQLTDMGRVYSDPRIVDGTQWVLWIEQLPSQKAIYFNNAFPEPIIAFVSELSTMLDAAGASTVTWQVMPADEANQQQSKLWSRIES